MKLKSVNAYRRRYSKKWDLSTAKRHIDRPYYQCRNQNALKQLVIGKRTRGIILEITDRIIEKFNPDTIILFGSRSKGLAKRYSDIDLLVVMKGRQENTIGMAWLMIEEIISCPLKCDIKVATPAMIGEWAHVKSSIYNNAIRGGFHLYEKTYKQSIWYIKSAKKSLKIIKKNYSEDTSISQSHIAITHSMLCAIITDGEYIPPVKKVNELVKYVNKIWNLTVYEKDLEKLQNRKLNLADTMKLSSDIYNAVNKEFCRRVKY